MFGDELAVKQAPARAAHRRDKPRQRDLGRVRPAREHRFAAEHPVEADAVEPADENAGAVLGLLPAFDRMRVAEFVQTLVAGLDAVADPAALAIAARHRASLDHLRERGVARDREPAAPQGACQRVREVEPVERKDGAQPWLDPEDVRIVPPVRHREDSRAIGEQQQLGL